MVLLVLIKIGDTVIFAGRFILSLLQKLQTFFKNVYINALTTVQTKTKEFTKLFSKQKKKQGKITKKTRSGVIFKANTSKTRLKALFFSYQKRVSQFPAALYSLFNSFILSLKTRTSLSLKKTAKVLTSCKTLVFSGATSLRHALQKTGVFIASLIPKRKPRIKPIVKHGRKPRMAVPFSPLPFLVKFRFFLAGSLFSFICVFLPLLIVIFIQDLPNPQELTLRQSPQTTKIFDRNGTLLYQVYANQNRTLVPLSEIPKQLQQATIAIEDKNFYKHPGFDITAIIRSAKENVSGGELQGGSTLTQQLIKSTLLTPETQISRKIKEVILAFWAERIYTKNQILEMYFNQVPYGGTAWGVEAASEVYFGKDVKDLDLSESAFLAGIPRAPTIYSPYGTTPNAWRKRQKDVLYRMAELGYITEKQAEEAVDRELQFQPSQIPLKNPHFVMYVKDYLTKKYGLSMVERGGLNVTTSIDTKLQEDAQRIVTDEVARDGYLNLTNAAALVTNPANGDILAMVGSKDYYEPGYGAVNLTTAQRQPGSSIKLVTYAAALSHGFTAATILDDSPISFANPGAPVYTPANYDGRSHGRIPLRLAFANSFNITAVKTLNQVGIPTMVRLGKDMGATTWKDPDQYGLSVTLGAAETPMVDMATIYGSVANGGIRVNLNPILKITDYKGNTIEEKTENPLSQGKRVLDEGVAFILSNILADNSARALAFGANSTLVIPGKTVSVKTGTTDWKRDNWTIGFTPSRLVAVWVGNNDNTPMSQTLASGVTGAAPIWHNIMVTVLQDKPDEKPQMPLNVLQKPCYGRIEYFVRGTENSVNCSYIPPTPKKDKDEGKKPENNRQR